MVGPPRKAQDPLTERSQRRGQNLVRRPACGAKLPQGFRAGSLGQSLTIWCEGHLVVPVAGRRDVQGGLKDPVHMGGGEQIDPAGHKFHLLVKIV